MPRIVTPRLLRSLPGAAIAALLLSPLPAFSGMLVNQVTDGLQVSPAAASNGEVAVVVWLTRPVEGSVTEVRGRRLGPQGGPRGDEFVVSSSACAVAPDVAVAPDGAFVVAFVDCRPDEPGHRLVVQGFNRWGQPAAERTVVGRATTRSVKVATDGNGAVAVAFSLQPEGDRQTLHLARIDPDGRPPEVAQVDSEAPSLYGTALEVDGLALADDGSAVILWHGLRAAESWIAVDAVDHDGFTRRWNLAECVIGEQPGACDDAALGRWGSELLAVWSESQVAAEYSIAAQRLASSGEPLGAPWTVVDGHGDDHLRGHLDVGRVSAGSPFVLWAERRDATSPASTVVGRPIGPDWPPGALLTVAPGPDARAPRVAATTEQGSLVVWLQGEGTDTDIAARLLRPLEPTPSPALPAPAID